MDEKRFTRLDDKIDKLDEKVDQVNLTLAKIEITLGVNTQSLVEHIKRTNLLEEKLEPVEKHVTNVNVIGKFLMGALGVIATIAGIYAVFFN